MLSQGVNLVLTEMIVRIVGGSLRGRSLRAPASRLTRPTSDRTREALFSILGAMPEFDIDDARVIDLFAGTGALGFEALSRGAQFSLFVETDSAARGVLRDNSDTLELMGVSKIYKRDATQLGPRPASVGPVFDLAFLDPPYEKDLATRALEQLDKGGWLAPSAMVIVEESARITFVPPATYQLFDTRKYGDTSLHFMLYNGSA